MTKFRRKRLILRRIYPWSRLISALRCCLRSGPLPTPRGVMDQWFPFSGLPAYNIHNTTLHNTYKMNTIGLKLHFPEPTFTVEVVCSSTASKENILETRWRGRATGERPLLKRRRTGRDCRPGLLSSFSSSTWHVLTCSLWKLVAWSSRFFKDKYMGFLTTVVKPIHEETQLRIKENK